MAESIVIAVIAKITEALAGKAVKPVCCPLIDHKLAALAEIQSRINQIKSELLIMQAFLRYADANVDHDQALLAWAGEVRDTAYQIEDIIDEYMFLADEQQNDGLTGSLHNIVCNAKNIKIGWHLVSKLQEIETRLQHLSQMKDRYTFHLRPRRACTNDANERWGNLVRDPHFIDEEEIVGINENKELLVRWLEREEQQRIIISVWGMGGLGKTTLVSVIYKDHMIKNNFECSAWINVSQVYKINDLLQKIVKDLCEEKKEIIPHDIETMDYHKLVKMLRNYLAQKRYLIVLDDVWSTDVWDGLQVAFIDSKCRSRVVLTTREYDVAMLATQEHIIKLKGLKSKDVWTLFCRKAFLGRSCPKELEVCAHEILWKCQGLPLAIVALGSLLSLTEKSELEWRRIHDGLSWQLTNNPKLNAVKSILNLSFKELPWYLKNCFLYCTTFPEDYLMKRKRLIRLWIAAGLVEERAGNTIEDVAEDYLNELIHRCMLQVALRNMFGRVKFCRMHDYVRELTLSISESYNFSLFYDVQRERFAGNIRHLSIYTSNRNVQLSTNWYHLRSLIFFKMTICSVNQLHLFLPRLKMLAVLDLEGVPIKTLPSEVCKLYNLRYLGLRRTKVKVIPNSLQRLRYLQTLDLYDTMIQRLPDGIAKLKQLRHLFVESVLEPDLKNFNSFRGVPTPKGIWELNDLQTLQSIEANGEIVCRLGSMTQLRRLRMMNVKTRHCDELCGSMKRLKRLHHLDIVARDGVQEPLELKGFSPPPLLRKLLLRGRLATGMAPHWFGSLTNLRILSLGWSQLRENPLPSLQKLPNLVYLDLQKAYNGSHLCFQAGWFSNLLGLWLNEMPQLEQMKIEDGAMGKLQLLCLMRCGKLQDVPEGIEHLTMLQEFFLIEMPENINTKVIEKKLQTDFIGRVKVQNILAFRHEFLSDSKKIWENYTAPS